MPKERMAVAQGKGDLTHTLVGCAGVRPTQPVESGPHAGCLAGGVRSREAAHAGWMLAAEVVLAPHWGCAPPGYAAMHACVRGVMMMAKWPSPEHRSSSGACELFFTGVTLRTGLLWFVESNPPDTVSPPELSRVCGRVRGGGATNTHLVSGQCVPTPPRTRLCAAPPPAPQSRHARRLQAAAQQRLRRLLQLPRALQPGRRPCAP